MTAGAVVEVGIRDLRDHLSRYIKKAQEGGDVVITDHGHPVARLTGVDKQGALERLIAAGAVTLPSKERTPSRLHRHVKVKGSLSDAVIEQRGR